MEHIIIKYEQGNINTDILLILGYHTSDAPNIIGTKEFPKLPINPGITKKKIISNPCKVIQRRYMFTFSQLTILLLHQSSSYLITNDIIVPDIPKLIETHK